MLKRCILAENRKLHASPIWAMFFLLPVLSATYGTRPFNWGLLAFTLALGAVLFALAWRKVQDEEV